ncbi:MAG: hypothetical protein H0W59_05060, partial [Chloroflexia bacterium]|nr:hypothetical protein [Chloroflexia bacterium]
MRTTLVNHETGERRFSIGTAFVIGVLLTSALAALPVASMAQTTPPPIVPTPQ